VEVLRNRILKPSLNYFSSCSSSCCSCFSAQISADFYPKFCPIQLPISFLIRNMTLSWSVVPWPGGHDENKDEQHNSHAGTHHASLLKRDAAASLRQLQLPGPQPASLEALAECSHHQIWCHGDQIGSIAACPSCCCYYRLALGPSLHGLHRLPRWWGEATCCWVLHHLPTRPWTATSLSAAMSVTYTTSWTTD